MNPLPRISILIRTFNSAKTLEELFSKMDFEEGDQFVVVDSGSTDATLEIARKYKADIVVAEGPFNYSKSLNLGFRASVNPWVVVISSHCVPVVPDFLALYRREVVKFPPNMVAGYAPSTLSGESDPNFDCENTLYFTKDDYPRVCGLCSNRNTIYRRTAWEELSFDETIRTAEDRIWIAEMVQRDYQFAYIPKVRCVNENQGSLIYMFRKGFGESRTLRSSNHRPMRLIHFAGAIKNLLKQRLKKKISNRNFVAWTAHSVGVFFGSRLGEDNRPN